MPKLNTLSIVSIQYELILTLRHGDEVVQMMKRFMRTCIKRLGAASAQFYFKRLFVEWGDADFFEEASGAPSVLKMPLRTQGALDWGDLYDFLAVELDEKRSQWVTHFMRDGRHHYAIIAPPIGVLVLQKEGDPFEEELLGILDQTAPKISECCHAWVERDSLRREIALRKQVEDKLQHSRRLAEEASNTDFLTGLANRRALATFIQSLSDDPAGREREVGIVLIDLDHFKRLNDRFGHNAGDLALQHVADVLRDLVDDDDFAGRIGGDEFLAILRAPGSRETLEVLAARIIERISRFDREGDYNCGFGASIGVSFVSLASEPDVVNITADADEALYEAKRKRNRFCFFDESLQIKNLRRSSAIEMIRAALDRGDFVPHFQPQISVDHGGVIGVEALARWQHPTEGLIPPYRFLPLAEDVGLLDSIDAAILRAGLTAMKTLDADGVRLDKISFNVTASKLSDRTWLGFVTQLAEDLGLSRDRIVFEIVESIMFDGDSAELIGMVRTCVDSGFRIHLDDFGTGHASISALRLLPFSCVKIDKTFVRGINEDEELQTMMSGIIKIIRGSKMTPLVEGVETREEVETLNALGVDLFQGYHFARPLPLDQLRGFLLSEAGRGRAGSTKIAS